MRLTRLALALAFASPAALAQTNLYWGDVHLHSNISTDAYATGNRTVTPDMAYRFARGLPITHPTLDAKVRIDRPLDFLAVTDHDINMGIDTMILEEHALLQASARGREVLAAAKGADPWPGFMRYRAPDGNTEELQAQVYTPEIRLSAWQREIDAAENNYIPGTFTTFFGWEWTSAPEGKNLHRVVLSNATPETANDFYPYGTGDSPRPEDLWAWLDATSQRVGIDFVAIPHNSNISGGLMFSEADTDGRGFGHRRQHDESAGDDPGKSPFLADLVYTLATYDPAGRQSHACARVATGERLNSLRGTGVSFTFTGKSRGSVSALPVPARFARRVTERLAARALERNRPFPRPGNVACLPYERGR